MAITIDLPQVGESVVEGIIGKWLKKPGDKLEKYDPLVEVVTDKVTMEVPSPVAGVLTRILVEEGATVPMGTPIAEVESEGPQPAPPQRAAQAQPSVGQHTPAEDAGTTGYLVKDVKLVGPTGGGVEEEGLSPQATSPPTREPAEKRARYSPSVRRLARERNLDLSRVTGTGGGGRITKEDVLAYVETQAAKTPSATAVPTTTVKPATGEVDSESEAVALSPVRRIIARNMEKSAAEIPHAWSMVEVDVSGLVGFRESIKEEFQRTEGVELTYLPFAVKAVADSLKEHPKLNSTWGGDRIILKREINVGIAVATPDGLVVPVIHGAESMSITGLAKAARELTGKAREGKLTLQDVQKGTFTVNNTGALGSIVSQPIINYPQAAILTTEAIQKRPIVVDDAIAVRSMMNVCLSFDHRIVDGAESGAFLQSVKGRLEAIGPGTSIQ